jgi:glycine cleavage system H protein
MQPEELLYSKTHEWVHVSQEDGKKIAIVGISAFAIEQLTDLVYIALPEVGRQIDAGESFGEIESVKAVSDLYCPVTGTIIAVNSTLPDALETFSNDPYGDGWIMKLEVSDDAGLDQLLDHATYQQQCAEQS